MADHQEGCDGNDYASCNGNTSSAQPSPVLAAKLSLKVSNKQFDAEAAKTAINDFFKSEAFKGITRRYDGSAEAKEGLRTMRSHLFDEFIEQVSVRDATLPATRHNNDLAIAPLAKLHNKILGKLLDEYVLSHPRMATYEVGQERVIKDLFRQCIRALAYQPADRTFDKKRAKLDIFPADMREDIESNCDNPVGLLRLLADHIAGMTDGYAIRLHARLTGVGIGTFNEFL